MRSLQAYKEETRSVVWIFGRAVRVALALIEEAFRNPEGVRNPRDCFDAEIRSCDRSGGKVPLIGRRQCSACCRWVETKNAVAADAVRARAGEGHAFRIRIVRAVRITKRLPYAPAICEVGYPVAAVEN